MDAGMTGGGGSDEIIAFAVVAQKMDCFGGFRRLAMTIG